MYQPTSSLNLPDYQIEELHQKGLLHCDDIDSQKLSDIGDLTGCPTTKTALDVFQEERLAGSILTLHKNLDEALKGGVAIGLITEFCGYAGCGKTQLCLQLCVSVQLPAWCGGLSGEAVYICTNNGFSSRRLEEIVKQYIQRYEALKPRNEKQSYDDELFNVKSIMERVHYMKVGDVIELLAVSNYLEMWIKEHKSVRLVIIDTICNHLKSLKEEKHSTLYFLLNKLQNLAKIHRFAIVLTNNFTTKITENSTVQHVPSLRDTYFHRINVRILLSRITDQKISASIVKSIHELKTVDLIL